MRFLIWLVVLFWAGAILRRLVVWMLRGLLGSVTPGRSASTNRQSTVGSRRLARDPVCWGTVAEERAISLRDKGRLVHFCSVACRDRYISTNQKFAANG